MKQKKLVESNHLIYERELKKILKKNDKSKINLLLQSRSN